MSSEISKSPPLLVADLDGTLLDRGGILLDRHAEKLNQLIAGGALFTVATGRNLNSVSRVLQDLRLELPVVTLNGACVSDLQQGRHLDLISIQSDVAKAVVQMAKDMDVDLCVTASVEGEDKLYYPKKLQERMGRYIAELRSLKDRRLTEGQGPEQGCRGVVLGLTAIGELQSLKNFIAMGLCDFQDKLNLNLLHNRDYPGEYWLMCQDLRATKAEGINKLRQRCGLEACPLVVFGDSQNDLSMFAASAWSIAASGATQEIRRQADGIALSGPEGVMEQIEAGAKGLLPPPRLKRGSAGFCSKMQRWSG